MKMLKDNCFKVDIHLMPDLPLASPSIDIQMFETVFLTDVIAPDQVKIYPCEVTPYTTIQKWHDAGKYTPYSDTDPRALVDVVKRAVAICPPWVRLPRIVRDIPLTYIQGGNRYSNLRQMLQDEFKADQIPVKEIRTREIGRNPGYRFERAVYKYYRYRATGSIEYFIALESWDSKALFGFVRLRIPPTKHTPVFSCLRKKGLVRELHVYNWLVGVGTAGAKGTTQHRGVGKKLLMLAEWVAWAHGLEGTAVITGEGVRHYYHKNGYHDDDTFAIKRFGWTRNMLLFVLGVVFCSINILTI
jgi:ELP3 family radical SAM enzyme/protein acetyltransferase